VSEASLELEANAIAVEGWQRPSTALLALANPAAGGGFRHRFDGSVVTVVRSIAFTLVTSATVAARIATVAFAGPTDVPFATFASPYTVAASLTSLFTFAVGVNQAGANNAGAIVLPIPEYRLEVGTSVVVTVGAVDTTDQVGTVWLALEQWPVRPPIGN
jgi:hypothetical protein